MDYNHSPVTAGPPPYGSVNYGGPFGQGPSRPIKRGNRATQSVAPAKADRANQQIIDQLTANKDDIKALKEDWGSRFDRIEQLLHTIGAERGVPADNADVKPSAVKVETRATEDQNVISGKATVKDQPTHIDSSVTSFALAGTDSTESDAVATQNNAIYIEHETAAQKLFRWRSIKALLRQCKQLDFSDRTEDYVMAYEMDKGVLRFYGKGRQMRDSGYGSIASTAAASPAPSSISGPSDESSSTGSPASSPENLWGTGFTPTITEPRPINDVGGLNSDNTLKLDSKTILRLLKSYFDNIHILHPFLKEGELTKQVENFKLRYNPQDSNSSKGAYVVPAVDSLRDPYAARAPKRKHSDGQYYSAMGEPGLAPSPMSSKMLLERSPETAKILLVMALGKICECREPLPGPVPDNSKDPNLMVRPYSPRTDSPPPTYPMRQSPSSSSHTTATASIPSPMSLGRFANSSPRSSAGELPAGARNVDVIPGLAYYAQATDILGNLTGYHELINSQCCLLAGLYAGQLANTLESLTWIQAASRICRFLVKEPNFKAVREPKKESIKLAFWTSLQLESDILAELDIPPSGIQEVQQDVPYPKGTMGQGDFVHGDTGRPDVMAYYSFQLLMRKTLNDIQKELYQEKDTNFQRATRSTSLRNAFNAMISDWRNSLPEKLQWDDASHVVDNINDSRLRGKFYGAQYIIHRPFLHAALDYDFEDTETLSKSPPNDTLGNIQNHLPLHPAPGPEMGPPKSVSDYERRRHETIELAVICIKAAMRSTVAFDGVLDHRRMVVTNIMGTAHAQFGNMLVLSAAFKSKTLGAYIEPQKLDYLFGRTIKLLKNCSPISSTLAKDCYILQCLRKVVFNSESEAMTTSFSSE
ncbi:hypothetical protein P7C71_g3888, partial [Lecanoromycetidae sp. Uapishka_2]